MAERRQIRAATLYDGISDAPQRDHAVLIQGGRIVDVVAPGGAGDFGGQVTEVEIAAPGFIDLQLNGAGGVLFNDRPEPEALRTIAAGARRGGTAYLLPTFITDAGSKYTRALQAVRDCDTPGVIGLHLEGPFLSEERPGVHPADCIRHMTPEDIALLSEAGMPLLLTLAPEEATPAQIAALAGAGVTLFAGHSQAGYEDMTAAEAVGLRGATHLFNAMSQIAGRAPGVVGAVLGSDRLFAGIIADGIHVHPANLRLALGQMGADRLFLVSDAMSPLGTGMRSFDLLGKRIYRRDGRLTDEAGTLAGADLSMIQAVTRMDTLTGCGLGTAIRMATRTPARAMGLDDSLGALAPGMRAGLTVLEADLSVRAVVVDGNWHAD